MPEIFAELDVVVCASRSEAMPLAVMEAMASGLPVIGSKVGGVPDMIQQGVTGWLVDEGDDEDIAVRVLELLSDAQRAHRRRPRGAATSGRALRAVGPGRRHARPARPARRTGSEGRGRRASDPRGRIRRSMSGRREPVDLGDLRRLEPVDSGFGLGRGKPVDRHYIEDFLGRHALDIRGRVLEVSEAADTTRFGADRVTGSDILHADGSNPRATLVGDLADGGSLPANAFDCLSARRP